ncbi:MAG: hypothetical protein DMG41_11255 [Acidobacteria bacterium]|nr:MAG: hypothetical protein AUH13_03535 [Acidobacteria bacterium 13_2_20CM_58_27]PYT78311.1 MAG: hypothetical protein DMG42_00930 [Acidobacteriota bacterium]PYT88609.1 MAG: hypothetical protein DMG41_11255 [Acidobacteriota bacterium]
MTGLLIGLVSRAFAGVPLPDARLRPSVNGRRIFIRAGRARELWFPDQGDDSSIHSRPVGMTTSGILVFGRPRGYYGC